MAVAVAAATLLQTSPFAAAQDEDDPFRGPGPTTAPPPPAAPQQKVLPHFRLRGYAEPAVGAAVAFLDIEAERRLVRAGEAISVPSAGTDVVLDVSSISEGAVTLTVREDGRKLVVR